MSIDDGNPKTEELINSEIPEQVDDDQETDFLQPVTPDPEVDEALSRLEAASGIPISQEHRDALQSYIDYVKQLPPEAHEQAYADFFTNNPELTNVIRQLSEFQKIVKGSTSELTDDGGTEEGIELASKSQDKPEEDIRQKEEDLEEAREEMHNTLAASLAKEITELVRGGEWDKEMSLALIGKLVKAGLPESTAQTLAEQIGGMKDSVTSEMLMGLLKPLMEQNKDNIEQNAAVLSDYREAMTRLNELPDGDPSRKEVMNAATKAAESVLDQVPMDGIIDLIFATGYGAGGYHGRYDGWSSGETDSKKEADTLDALKQLFDDEEGTKLFFAELTETSSDEVYKNLVGKLDQLFNSLDSAKPEDKKQLQERFSKAVDKAAESPGLFGLKLEADQVSFSKDVLKRILMTAHKSQGKNK